MARRRPWVRWGWQPMDTAMHRMEARPMDTNLSLHNNQWYQRTTHQMGCHHRPWVRWVAPMEWYKRYNKGKDLWVRVNFFGGIAVWLGGQWELLSHLCVAKLYRIDCKIKIAATSTMLGKAQVYSIQLAWRAKDSYHMSWFKTDDLGCLIVFRILYLHARDCTICIYYIPTYEEKYVFVYIYIFMSIYLYVYIILLMFVAVAFRSYFYEVCWICICRLQVPCRHLERNQVSQMIHMSVSLYIMNAYILILQYGMFCFIFFKCMHILSQSHMAMASPMVSKKLTAR